MGRRLEQYFVDGTGDGFTRDDSLADEKANTWTKTRRQDWR